MLGVCPSGKTAESEKAIETIAHCCGEKNGMSAEKIQNVFKKFPIVIPKWNGYKS